MVFSTLTFLYVFFPVCLGLYFLMPTLRAKNTVLLCDIKTYGQYLYAEGERQLDYYFICGEKPENVITRYKGL